jgi:hypothetical protein
MEREAPVCKVSLGGMPVEHRTDNLSAESLWDVR